jgi:hypothetical protein
MRGEVWNYLYLDKVKLIEDDIIGAFSESQISEAEVLAANVADMPVLATKGVLK